MNTTRPLTEVGGRRLALPLCGLVIAILGLVVQWVSKPSIFQPPNWGALPGNFPPGILVILVFGALTVWFARRWWTTLCATAISMWIFIGGIGTGEMGDAIAKGNAGSVLGLFIMSMGLVLAIISGIHVAVRRRRSDR